MVFGEGSIGMYGGALDAFHLQEKCNLNDNEFYTNYFSNF